MCLQNVALAVRALQELRTRQPWASNPRLSGARLVLAGGYDERLAENREHFTELRELVGRLGLQDQVRPAAAPGGR